MAVFVFVSRSAGARLISTDFAAFPDKSLMATLGAARLITGGCACLVVTELHLRFTAPARFNRFDVFLGLHLDTGKNADYLVLDVIQ